MGKRGIRTRNKKPLWFLEYLLVMSAIQIIRLLPFGTAVRIGGVIGGLLYRLDKRHRKIARENIGSCFKGMGAAEVESTARSVFVNLGYTIVEFIHSGRYGKAPLEKYFNIVNYEAFEKANSKGRGVLCLTGHCGNWELMALVHSIKGNPSGVVVRPVDNPYIDRFVTRLRSMYGNTMINKKGGMRDMLRTLREGRSVGVLLDQNVTASEGVFVDFFGRPSCTNKGMALIAARTNAPVIPMFTHRIAPGKNEIIYMDEIPLADTGDKEADMVANTQNYTRAIEDFIRKYPDQWFWMHRRWKSRPEDAVNA
ncbi:MAG TPA: lysophospholipid acyltransferase family protein [Nitrospirota bacterium]